MQGFDLFAYCGNNPINRIDISGANSIEITEEEKTGLLDKTEHEGCLQTGGDESNCERVGGGHGNPVHRERIDSFMDELAESGDYQTVYGNRALSTAGLEGSQRPDVIAVRNDGSYEIWEFASPSQACGTIGYSVLEAKIETMQAANPNARFHRIVPW